MVSLISTMQAIPLTQNKFAKVDDSDYEWLNSFKWHVARDGYVRRTVDNKAVYMHRLVNETPTGLYTDHINSDKLDNQRSNLRTVNKSQNNMNRGKQKNNQSGYKGVYRDKARGKWVAEIRLQTKKIFLGRFATAEQAYQVYLEAARKYHGEYMAP